VLRKLCGISKSTWIALFVAASVLLSSALSSVCVPSPGKHCRTAAVQKVKFMVAVSNGKGPLVLKPIDRAPRPGELAFKQCHCEDGKAAKELKEVPTNVPLLWVIPQKISFDLAEARSLIAFTALLPFMGSLATYPPNPPPDLA